jgi:hypothetical protein
MAASRKQNNFLFLKSRNQYSFIPINEFLSLLIIMKKFDQPTSGGGGDTGKSRRRLSRT